MEINFVWVFVEKKNNNNKRLFEKSLKTLDKCIVLYIRLSVDSE